MENRKILAELWFSLAEKLRFAFYALECWGVDL